MKCLFVIAAFLAVAYGAVWNTRNCGREVRTTSEELSTENRIKIVGGTPTFAGEIPYQVLMGRVGRATGYCGASYMTNNWVVTAAHCTAGESPSSTNMRFGEWDTGRSNSYRQNIVVSQFFDHPDYDDWWLTNDISLVRLRSTPDLNSHVDPICRGTTDTYAGSPLRISGWGTIRYEGPSSAVLLYANIQGVSDLDCRAAYGREFIPTGGMMCAGDPNFRKDTCQGDSGGPLAYFNPGSRIWQLVGVVSWGYECAVQGYPGIYARVSHFFPWIDETLRDN